MEEAHGFRQSSAPVGLSVPMPGDTEDYPKEPNPLGPSGHLLIRPYQPEAAASSGAILSSLGGGMPNIKFGYTYYFGPSVRQGRWSADNLLPIDVGPDATVFGEIRGEYQGSWFTTPDRNSGARTDLSVGGGYRRLMDGSLLFGANGFFDTTRFADKWYSSGGWGLEMAFPLPGNTLVDLNFNYYGSMFPQDDFVNAFRSGPSNFDLEMGYCVPILDNVLDLRLKAGAYQFDADPKIYGWRTGIEFTSSCGVFNAKYEFSSDELSGPYHSLGGYITVGLQLEKLFSGETPFSKPQRVLGLARNMRRYLHIATRRSWYQPAPKI